MAKTEKTEKKIIVRRVRPVNYSSRNLTISIVIIVLVFMIQIFLFFYLNIGVLSVLFIGILFLFMYMLLLLTLLNPFVIGDGIKHLIIQRSEISNIKNKVSESENTKEKNETDEHGLKEIVKEKVKRAFLIIMLAYLTVVVAMIPLIFAGAGLLKGFAITTIIGVTIGVFVTRPAYSAFVEIMMR